VTLRGKVAIVTAAAGAGIGQAIAWGLATQGAAVVVSDSNAKRPFTLADDIRASCKVETLGFQCDVSKSKEVQNMVEETLNKFGRIDILINNAGIEREEVVEHMSDQDWDLIMDVILKGTFYCCRAVLPTMLRQKNGRIVNLSSVSAWAKTGSSAAYCAAKAGITGFTKALAWEVSAQGITANAIAPGFIWNEYLGHSQQAMEVFSKNKERILVGRYGNPADIANTALFLVSDEASYITGETICVSGGFHMR